MYESLTGIAPFRGKSSAETFAKHFTHTPPLLSEAYQGISVPFHLDQSISKMLSKVPSQRFQSMKEISDMLMQVRDRALL